MVTEEQKNYILSLTPEQRKEYYRQVYNQLHQLVYQPYQDSEIREKAQQLRDIKKYLRKLRKTA